MEEDKDKPASNGLNGCRRVVKKNFSPTTHFLAGASDGGCTTFNTTDSVQRACSIGPTSTPRHIQSDRKKPRPLTPSCRKPCCSRSQCEELDCSHQSLVAACLVCCKTLPYKKESRERGCSTKYKTECNWTTGDKTEHRTAPIGKKCSPPEREVDKTAQERTNR